ncbi:Protein of unknown function [Gryllus bimaculatus]|nr:Protein of unknown function [Gryllus bimaculatus]
MKNRVTAMKPTALRRVITLRIFTTSSTLNGRATFVTLTRHPTLTLQPTDRAEAGVNVVERAVSDATPFSHCCLNSVLQRTSLEAVLPWRRPHTRLQLTAWEYCNPEDNGLKYTLLTTVGTFLIVCGASIKVDNGPSPSPSGERSIVRLMWFALRL